MKRLIFFLIFIFALWAHSEWSEAQETSKDSTSRPLSFDINYVYRQGGTGDLKSIQFGDVLHSGDHYKIVFTPDKDCYVYIFQVDSSGQVFQLFPMESFRGVRVNQFNPVKQGKKYVLPSPDKAFLLDKKVGIERMYFIATREKNKELESLYAELTTAVKRENSSELQDTRSKLDKYFKKRGVKVVPSEQQMEVPWRETGDLFLVMSQRLENLSKERIHVLEFVHE